MSRLTRLIVPKLLLLMLREFGESVNIMILVTRDSMLIHTLVDLIAD